MTEQRFADIKSLLAFGNLQSQVRDAVAELIEEVEELSRRSSQLLVACKSAATTCDQLSLGPLDAAAKYGPDYEPPDDEYFLNVRGALAEAIAKAEADGTPL
jgi:dynactin complex subunit